MGRERTILDAAAEAFHEKGFHGVGVDEIGTRAGMSGPSLYRHFAGKDEILATLLDEAMDELMSVTAPVLDDPALDLDRALRHHIRFAVSHRQLVGLYQREVRSLAEPWSRAFAHRRAQYTKRWESLLGARLPGLGTAELSAATQACLGMVFSVTTWPERAVTPEVESVVMALLAAGLPGLAPDASNNAGAGSA